jgi:hypothetical protein
VTSSPQRPHGRGPPSTAAMIVIGPYREHGVLFALSTPQRIFHEDHMCRGVRKVGTLFHGNPTTPMVAAVANN